MAFGKPSVIKSERIKMNETGEETNEVIVEAEIIEEAQNPFTIENTSAIEKLRSQNKINFDSIEPSQKLNEVMITESNKAQEINYQPIVEQQSKREGTQRIVIEAQQKIVEERIERLEEQNKHMKSLEEQARSLKSSYKNMCLFEIFIGVPILIGILFVFNNFLMANLGSMLTDVWLQVGTVEIIAITLFMMTISYAMQKIYDNNKVKIEKEIQVTEEKIQTLKKDIWIF